MKNCGLVSLAPGNRRCTDHRSLIYDPPERSSLLQARLCNHRQTGNPVLCSRNLGIGSYVAAETVVVGSPDEAVRNHSHPCSVPAAQCGRNPWPDLHIAYNWEVNSHKIHGVG